jgi:ribonuclease Z
VREQQIDPDEYYPEGYKPMLLDDWPVDSDQVIDMETLPDALEASMGEAWRDRKVCHEYIAKRENDSGEEALEG